MRPLQGTVMGAAAVAVVGITILGTGRAGACFERGITATPAPVVGGGETGDDSLATAQAVSEGAAVKVSGPKTVSGMVLPP